MDHWTDRSFWRERREELLWQARKTRGPFAHARKRPGAVEVRWGLPNDEAKIARLLDLNGMPRWVAFEERFVVAEQGDGLLAAVRYRTEPKRLAPGAARRRPVDRSVGQYSRRRSGTSFCSRTGSSTAV